MDSILHVVSRVIEDITKILVNVHILSLFIINLTETPRRAWDATEGYTMSRRFYRIIEVFAGIVTPLAKR